MSFFQGTKYHNWAATTAYLQSRYDALRDGWWIDGQFYSVTDLNNARRAAVRHLEAELNDWDGPGELN